MREVPVVVVPIEGNPALAAGRLAVHGIQNLCDFRPPGRAAARLRADSAEAAKERVAAALGEEYAVGEPVVETFRRDTLGTRFPVGNQKTPP